jgi:hypothetical protein
MDAIQRLRAKAEANGKLKATKEQKVRSARKRTTRRSSSSSRPRPRPSTCPTTSRLWSMATGTTPRLPCLLLPAAARLRRRWRDRERDCLGRRLCHRQRDLGQLRLAHPTRKALAAASIRNSAKVPAMASGQTSVKALAAASAPISAKAPAADRASRLRLRARSLTLARLNPRRSPSRMPSTRATAPRLMTTQSAGRRASAIAVRVRWRGQRVVEDRR